MPVNFLRDYRQVLDQALQGVTASVENLGATGVFIGTFCSTILTSFWVEPYILYKHRFHASPARFFLRYVVNLAVMAVVWLCTHLCCGVMNGGAFFNLVFRLVICLIVPNVLLLLIYWRTPECKEFIMQSDIYKMLWTVSFHKAMKALN